MPLISLMSQPEWHWCNVTEPVMHGSITKSMAWCFLFFVYLSRFLMDPTLQLKVNQIHICVKSVILQTLPLRSHFDIKEE